MQEDESEKAHWWLLAFLEWEVDEESKQVEQLGHRKKFVIRLLLQWQSLVWDSTSFVQHEDSENALCFKALFMHAQSRIMYVKSLHFYKYICILMLWADYKPDQFINGPPWFINWSSTLHWLAHFKIYKTMCSCLETRPNGLEAGWILYKQPECHASYTRWLDKQPMAQTAWKLDEWFTDEKHTSKVVLQARPNKVSMNQILKAFHTSDAGLVGFKRVTSKAIRLTWKRTD